MHSAESGTTHPTSLRTRAALRTLDLLFVLASAAVWLPLMAIVGVVIVATSGRPVFFTQRRIGRDEVPFTMLKFRSMVRGDNPLVPDPDRITAVGNLLRRTSIDELPQLINVIRGQMSLVGPRPMLEDQLSRLDAHDRRRARMRPGLTGTAQVNGRNSLTWDQRFVHDVSWADDPSVRTYLSTLRRTVRVLVTGDGVTGHDPDDRFVSVAPTVIRLVDFDLSELDAAPCDANQPQNRAA